MYVGRKEIRENMQESINNNWPFSVGCVKDIPFSIKKKD